MFLNVWLMTFCRSDQFKSFHTFVQAFEFIRSIKAHQTNIQKHDLLQKNWKFACGLRNESLHFWPQNDIFEKVYTSDVYETLKLLISNTIYIYGIGAEILYETCFGHNSTQNAPKSMIPVRVCTVFCVDSESAIKTRF